MCVFVCVCPIHLSFDIGWVALSIGVQLSTETVYCYRQMGKDGERERERRKRERERRERKREREEREREREREGERCEEDRIGLISVSYIQLSEKITLSGLEGENIGILAKEILQHFCRL